MCRWTLFFQAPPGSYLGEWREGSGSRELLRLAGEGRLWRRVCFLDGSERRIDFYHQLVPLEVSVVKQLPLAPIVASTSMLDLVGVGGAGGAGGDGGDGGDGGVGIVVCRRRRCRCRRRGPQVRWLLGGPPERTVMYFSRPVSTNSQVLSHARWLHTLPLKFISDSSLLENSSSTDLGGDKCRGKVPFQAAR
jgi:hypothetical protein